MKKVTTFHHKRLQHLLKHDDEFRRTNMFHYANALVSFATETITVGHTPVSFPIDCATVIPFGESVRKVFDEISEKTTRVEAQLWPGVADCCIGVQMTFIGKHNDPLLSFFGGVDSQGVRKLDVTIVSDRLDSAKFFIAEHRRFALIGKA